MTNLYFQEKLFSVFFLFGALPMKMYTWEKFWDIWDSVAFFHMAGYVGQLVLACSWIPRREIEP